MEIEDAVVIEKLILAFKERFPEGNLRRNADGTVMKEEIEALRELLARKQVIEINPKVYGEGKSSPSGRR